MQVQTISFRKCRSKVYRCIYQSKDLGDTRACCKLRVPHVPREKCVCVTDKGKFVGLNRELINLFQVDDLYGFLPWDSSPFFNCSPPFWGSFELCMMIFQPPSQQILVNRLPEALIQDLLLWRNFAEKDPFSNPMCSFTMVTCRITICFYICIQIWGREPYTYTFRMSCISLLILLMFCH